MPALPHLAILDTSKTPYMWSTPNVENPIGSLNEHTSIMVKNYMITAFGNYNLFCIYMIINEFTEQLLFLILKAKTIQ